MKHQPKLLTALVTLILVIASFSSYAQTQNKLRERPDPPTPEKRAQMQTDLMEKHLQLSTQQKSQVYNANLEAAKKMHAIIEQRAIAENRDKIKEIQEHRNAQLKSILSEQQYSKMTDRSGRGRIPDPTPHQR